MELSVKRAYDEVCAPTRGICNRRIDRVHFPTKVDGYKAIPTCGGEMRWGGRIDLRETFYFFLISHQPSHSYTHRVRNGLTIAANRITLFLATISCGDEQPSPRLRGSQGKPTEHNPRRPRRRLHVAQTLVIGGRVACRMTTGQLQWQYAGSRFQTVRGQGSA
jgi:hypothetical protein